MPPTQLDDAERLGFISDPGSTDDPWPARVRIEPDTGILIDVPVSPRHFPLPQLMNIPQPPPILTFADEQGRLTLGDCRGLSIKRLSGTGCSRWSIQAAYAVAGADHPDESVKQIEALRSTLTGLHDWMGWRNTTMTVRENIQGGTDEVTIRKEMLESIRIPAADVNVVLTPSVGMRDFEFTGDSTDLTSESAEPLSWVEHFKAHHSLRNLIALCVWEPVDFVGHEVRHPGPGRRLVSGKVLPPPWRDLFYVHHSRRVRGVAPAEPTVRAEHFGYWDLTEADVRTWMEINTSHRRAIAPLMSHLYLKGLPVETQMSHVGACLEALRFADLCLAGRPRRAAANEPIGFRAKCLAEQMPEPVASLIGDASNWSGALARSYNSVKHANRDPVDPADLFWLVSSGALVARTRLLQLAGISDDAFRRLKSSGWWKPMQEAVAGMLAREVDRIA